MSKQQLLLTMAWSGVVTLAIFSWYDYAWRLLYIVIAFGLFAKSLDGKKVGEK